MDSALRHLKISESPATMEEALAAIVEFHETHDKGNIRLAMNLLKRLLAHGTTSRRISAAQKYLQGVGKL